MPVASQSPPAQGHDGAEAPTANAARLSLSQQMHRFNGVGRRTAGAAPHPSPARRVNFPNRPQPVCWSTRPSARYTRPVPRCPSGNARAAMPSGGQRCGPRKLHRPRFFTEGKRYDYVARHGNIFGPISRPAGQGSRYLRFGRSAAVGQHRPDQCVRLGVADRDPGQGSRTDPVQPVLVRLVEGTQPPAGTRCPQNGPAGRD